MQLKPDVRCEFLCTSMKIHVRPAIIDSFLLWVSPSTKNEAVCEYFGIKPHKDPIKFYRELAFLS